MQDERDVLFAQLPGLCVDVLISVLDSKVEVVRLLQHLLRVQDRSLVRLILSQGSNELTQFRDLREEEAIFERRGEGVPNFNLRQVHQALHV